MGTLEGTLSCFIYYRSIQKDTFLNKGTPSCISPETTICNCKLGLGWNWFRQTDRQSDTHTHTHTHVHAHAHTDTHWFGRVDLVCPCFHNVSATRSLHTHSHTRYVLTFVSFLCDLKDQQVAMYFCLSSSFLSLRISPLLSRGRGCSGEFSVTSALWLTGGPPLSHSAAQAPMETLTCRTCDCCKLRGCSRRVSDSWADVKYRTKTHLTSLLFTLKRLSVHTEDWFIPCTWWVMLFELIMATLFLDKLLTGQEFDWATQFASGVCMCMKVCVCV